MALTLRAVGGLTTAEIARAFLVPESTMGQRISARQADAERVRARRSGCPPPTSSGAASAAVLHVLYLIFNEGYAGQFRAGRSPDRRSPPRPSGSRGMVHALLPDDPEVTGLLALMLLTDARRPARTDGTGDLVPLAEQDRAGGTGRPSPRASRCSPRRAERAGPARTRCRRRSRRCTTRRRAPTTPTGRRSLALYGLLERMAPGPMVTLARAVALAEAEGPDAAAAVLDSLDPVLGDHQRLHAVRGHVAELRGDRVAARRHYLAAAARATNLAEQRHLTVRAAALATSCDMATPSPGHEAAEP